MMHSRSLVPFWYPYDAALMARMRHNLIIQVKGVRMQPTTILDCMCHHPTMLDVAHAAPPPCHCGAHAITFATYPKVVLVACVWHRRSIISCLCREVTGMQGHALSNLTCPPARLRTVPPSMDATASRGVAQIRFKRPLAPQKPCTHAHSPHCSPTPSVDAWLHGMGQSWLVQHGCPAHILQHAPPLQIFVTASYTGPLLATRLFPEPSQ
uniref:Uncharacterized protein n=1 Tax=Eutreptiella gymnastica TaxID=73025 RepID=A0A7S1I8F0_9EUGL|mmetsp:Transcript_138328/g.240504  ORF Transcript_138328/g.240504 Transcript_138328/m.240504 type:complete len:210 (+) Transcript_138328:1779-2408(+)